MVTITADRIPPEVAGQSGELRRRIESAMRGLIAIQGTALRMLEGLARQESPEAVISGCAYLAGALRGHDPEQADEALVESAARLDAIVAVAREAAATEAGRALWREAARQVMGTTEVGLLALLGSVRLGG